MSSMAVSNVHVHPSIPSQIIAAVRMEGLLGLSELAFPAAASRESFVVGAVCKVGHVTCVFIAAAGQCAKCGHRGVFHQHVRGLLALLHSPHLLLPLCSSASMRPSKAVMPPAPRPSRRQSSERVGSWLHRGGQEGGQEGGVGVADDGACRNDNGQCGRGDAC